MITVGEMPRHTHACARISSIQRSCEKNVGRASDCESATGTHRRPRGPRGTPETIARYFVLVLAAALWTSSVIEEASGFDR